MLQTMLLKDHSVHLSVAVKAKHFSRLVRLENLWDIFNLKKLINTLKELSSSSKQIKYWHITEV